MVEYDYEQINKQELIWEDNNMSRLGMLYALNEEDVKKTSLCARRRTI